MSARATGYRGSDGDGLAVGEDRANGSYPQVQIAEIQRARLLSAVVRVVDEFGYVDATVARITDRARVSRRTFYELFENCEDCLFAMLENALDRIAHELTVADLETLPWRERVRQGLWAILSFFDREPVLARVCVVQAARGGERVQERRAEVFARLADVIDEGRYERARGGDSPALAAEGLVGAAHAIVYERLLKRDRESLVSLLGPLMAIIVLGYLGPAAARREQARSTPVSQSEPAGDSTQESITAERHPLEGVRMRMTYRTVLVLECIARWPGVSNRGVGDRAGVLDQGQISKLLARLERLGLVVNTGKGQAKGEPNAWTLTPTGQQVVHSINPNAKRHGEAA